MEKPSQEYDLITDPIQISVVFGEFLLFVGT